jgi:hypothetical protein
MINQMTGTPALFPGGRRKIGRNQHPLPAEGVLRFLLAAAVTRRQFDDPDSVNRENRSRE